MSFYVVYAKHNLAQLCVIKRPSEEHVKTEGYIRASRKNWGFRRNANWYAMKLAEEFNLATLGQAQTLYPLD